MRRLSIGFALALLLGLVPTLASADAAPCQFVLGFAALQGALPNVVGSCLDNEQHNPANGDGLQQTTTGLLVWRRADNWTAFTDGFHTWINGPNGLVERLNTQRFPWEADASGMPSASNIITSVQNIISSALSQAAANNETAANNSTTVSGGATATNVTSVTNGNPGSDIGASAQQTWHICGPDSGTEQAIGQFIAGRNASTTLVSDGNGCADLTVSVSGAANTGSNSSTSTQTVDHLSIKIVTANDATSVTISNV